jgi:heme-degrading monooxygenase HmoA
MSVFMTLKIPGNAQAMEQYAKAHPQQMAEVLDAAKRHGLIAHRFYGTQDGNGVLVLDEWPDRQSFEAFFSEQESAIRPMLESTHATGQPEPAFWEELATGDAYGWGA